MLMEIIRLPQVCWTKLMRIGIWKCSGIWKKTILEVKNASNNLEPMGTAVGTGNDEKSRK